jgi:hypothetical protein
MGYPYEKRADGILVRGVRVVKPLARAARKELAKNNLEIDEAFMRESAARFKADASKGRLFPLTLNHRGRRVGRIVNQDVVSHNGQPTFIEDILITEPATQERWLRGELPEISADIDLARREVFATSLLEEGEGHFGFDDIGQVYPKELQVAFEGEGHKLETTLCLQAEKETDMTPDELKALLAENNKVILAEVDKKLAPVLELSKKPNTDPLDPANDVIKERERAEVLIKDQGEKARLELAKEKDIGVKLAEAAQVDIGISLPAYRAQLEKRDTQARDDYHRLCLERAKHGRQSIQPSDDPAHKGKSRVELELSKDYTEEKANWERIGVTEEKYIEARLRARAQRQTAAA